MNATIAKLVDAINAHDAESMAALFTPDYRSEQPVHPNREYVGRDTLASIWGDLFRAVPDLKGEVVADVPDGGNVWVEWHWHGHHTDGSVFEMRGIARTGLTDEGLVAAQRLYGELVDREGPAIEEAERQLREPAR